MPMDAFTAASLGAVGAHCGSFDETVVRDGDDTAFVGDEIFHVDLAFVRNDLGEPLAAVFVRISRNSSLMISGPALPWREYRGDL